MPVDLVLALVAVFAFVSIVVVSLASFTASRSAIGRKRLRESAPSATPVLPEIVSLSRAQPSKPGPFLGLFARSDKATSQLRMRMQRAGYRQPSAALVFQTVELLTPVVVALAIVAALGVQRGWLIALLGGVLAFFVPGFMLERKIARRRREIENGLPDALDLLVVCMEAGSGLDQAIVKTSDELSISYPVLAEELRTVTTEIRAGKPRMEAFKSLVQRTKADDVRALVAMLAQTDRFGTSISQALRTHADTSRTKRRQRAEERAQKLAVKLVFPLVLFFFPALYIVILGPAIIHFVRDFN